MACLRGTAGYYKARGRRMHTMNDWLKRVVMISCLYMACFSILPLHDVTANNVAPRDSNDTLDMTGAIQIKDPFAACHADSYDLMADLGIKTNRKDISWSEVEPGDDAWNWQWWDYRMAGLKAKNMTALPILDYGNLAVQTGVDHGNRINTDHDIQEWLEYVNECVERYYVNDTRYTDHWEIWNEANLGELDADSGFWTGTDAEFFELQKITAANLSVQYPELDILSNGISGHNPDYLDAMFASGAMENIDTLAFHPYSGSNFDTLTVKIDEVQAVCAKNNFTGPLWITEVGMSTQFDPLKPGFEADYQQALELQATLVPKIFATSLAEGIELVVWYCLGDFNRGGEFEQEDWVWGEANFGLVFNGYNPYKPAPYANDTYKPSGYAYKALSHNLNWSTYVPNGVKKSVASPSNAKLHTFYFLKGNGDVVFICWNTNGLMTSEISFTVPATGIEVYSGPSYKPGEACNYTISPSVGGLDVQASVGLSPFIFVIDMPDGSSPVPIVVSTPLGVYDVSLIVIIPIVVGFCAVIFIIKITGVDLKKMKNRSPNS